MTELLDKMLLRIYDDNNVFKSYGFIIFYRLEDDNTRVKPYIIFNASNIINGGYVQFKCEKNGNKTNFNASFDKKYIDENKLADSPFVFASIASLLNSFNDQHLVLRNSNIDGKLLKLSDNKTNDFEDLIYLMIDDSLNELNLNSYFEFSKNHTSLNNDKEFFIIDNKDDKMGSPVFAYNPTSYVDNGKIFIGKRIILVGITEKPINQKFVVVRKISSINKIINEKYYDLV